MQREHEHLPGTPAPATGDYEELNIFGARIGKVAHVEEGEKLPPAPREFTWRRVTTGTVV